MKIAILGSNGFIGSGLVKEFSVDNEVVSINRNNYDEHIGEHFDIFINSAGTPRKYWAESHQLEDFDGNVTAVYKSIIDFKYDKYIYISSIDAIKRNSVYGLHKYLSEELIKSSCKSYLILRPGTVIGAGMKKGVVFDLINSHALWVTDDSKFFLITINGIYKTTKYLLNDKITNDDLVVAGTRSMTVKDIAKELDVKYTIRPDAEICEYDLRYEEIKSPELLTSIEYLTEFMQKKEVI